MLSFKQRRKNANFCILGRNVSNAVNKFLTRLFSYDIGLSKLLIRWEDYKTFAFTGKRPRKGFRRYYVALSSWWDQLKRKIFARPYIFDYHGTEEDYKRLEQICKTYTPNSCRPNYIGLLGGDEIRRRSC